MGQRISGIPNVSSLIHNLFWSSFHNYYLFLDSNFTWQRKNACLEFRILNHLTSIHVGSLFFFKFLFYFFFLLIVVYFERISNSYKKKNFMIFIIYKMKRMRNTAMKMQLFVYCGRSQIVACNAF